MTTANSASTTWQMKVYPVLTMIGWALVMLALVLGLFVLVPTATAYFGNNAKELRDVAEPGSTLLGQLETLSVIPRWLEPLIFLGVASFMVGIALEFSTIPNLLKNRGEVMSLCFPILVKKGE